MPSRQKAIAAVAGAGLAAVAIGVALYLLIWADGDSGKRGASDEVRLPRPMRDDAQETLVFLADRGGPLKTMHRTAASLADRPEAHDC